MEKVAAVILAGGRGKRMDILCDVRPKPALPFGGGLRVIDFSLSNCIHSRIGNVGVLTDYQRSHVAPYLTQWSLANAGKSNVQILEPKNGSYKGTADAVHQNLGYISETGAEDVLVLAGDHIYSILGGLIGFFMLAFHEGVKADVTVGVIRVPIEEAHRFGTVTSDPDGKIIAFAEKVKKPLSNLASMGIYVFNRNALFSRLEEDAARADSSHDFGYAILPGMVERDRVYAYEHKGYWQDIGTVEAYFAANMQMIAERPIAEPNGSRPVLTIAQSLPPCRISGRGSVRNSLVSRGCVVRGYVENSILSPGVWVDEKAVVKDSVVMANTFVGYHGEVHYCILDEEIYIGKFGYVGPGDSLLSGGRSITVMGKGASVPPHTVVGSNRGGRSYAKRIFQDCRRAELEFFGRLMQERLGNG